jgi:hypothetical protein
VRVQNASLDKENRISHCAKTPKGPKFDCHYTINAKASSSGPSIDAQIFMTTLCGAGELVVVYSIWKPIFCSGFDELKQFSGVT